MSFTFDDIAAPRPHIDLVGLRNLTGRITRMEAMRAAIRPEDTKRIQFLSDRIQRLVRERDRILAKAEVGRNK